MWFSALPSFTVVVGFLYLPQVVMYFANKVILGNTYTRTLNNYDQYRHFLRDSRLSGNDNPYNQKNKLDCWVPEPEPEKKCECP